MKKSISLSWCLLILFSFCTLQEANAQRRIIGGSDREKEDKEEANEKEKEEQAKEKAKKNAKKAEKDAEAKEAQEELEELAREKAEEEAEKAAEAAAQKAKEEEERKVREKLEKEAARLEANQQARLAQAKDARRFVRDTESFQVNITMRPGAPVSGQVVEVQFDIAKKLEVESAQYGRFKPQKKVRGNVLVTPPVTGKETGPVSYRLHRLATPGSYGFHFTPTRDGMHELQLDGATKKTGSLSIRFPVHPDAWPPPDFDEEEKKLKESGNSTGRTNRNIIVGQ
jgi:chemotaxis protein histidine kinase CheA